MIACPPDAVATDSEHPTASPPAALISLDHLVGGPVSAPSPVKPAPVSFTTTLAPRDASNSA